MNLPAPGAAYDQADEAAARRAMGQADKQNYKRGQDIELQPGQRLILRAPDGSRWRITVTPAGAVGAAAA
jgi:hypothetical protein